MGLSALGCPRKGAPPEEGPRPTATVPLPAASSDVPSPTGATPSSVPAGSPLAGIEPLPSGGVATPTEIVIKNGSTRSIGFGDRPAPVGGLYLVEESGHLGPLQLDGPPAPCECQCGPNRCANCGARAVQPIAIAPGGEHKVAWNGRARRHRRNEFDHCYDAFVPAPGNYVLVACGPSCESTRITLPPKPGTPLSITLSGNQRRADVCPSDPHFAERAARVALYTMAVELPAFRNPKAAELGACDPKQARCVAKSELDSLRKSTGCSIGIAPEPLEFEVRVWLDGDDYGTFVGPDAATVQRVRYAR